MFRSDKVCPISVKELKKELNYVEESKKEEQRQPAFSSCFWREIFSSTVVETLEEAQKQHTNLSDYRKIEMENIVLRGSCSVSWYRGLWGLIGSLLGICAVFVGFVLWPTENVFLHPEHWYECMLQCGIVWMGKFIHANLSFSLIYLKDF